MPKILVVDDEPLVLSTIERALSKSGYIVVPTSNEKDFLDALSKDRYDLLIMDMHIGFMSPALFIKKAKELAPDSKILTISGSYPSGVEGESFLQKPFRIEDLRARVRALIG